MVDDFASGALVAAVRRALADDGVAVEATPRTALVPLTVKRTLLAGVALLPLLRAGAAVLRERSDPMLAALCAASGPADLFDRWGRLERFTHSRHRVVVSEIGSDRLVAEHAGPPGEPPWPAEDAVILGLLTGLMGAAGARGLTVTAGAEVVYADGTFRSPGTDTARWCFTWSSLEPRAAEPAAGTGLAARARQMLASDLARHWALSQLAGDLAVSSRSLQRALHGVGGFTWLLATVRAEAAAELLRAGVHPLSVIGFTCGYADQPHFTREFRRRTAMTPGQYRSAFAPERPEKPEKPERHP
ncbi:helix-turn-helix transcriptional regulator [Actinoplanes aureus]|uniref:Helix-turn-helix transcriptional regulator n=1 Tax=Actinoplanes aureus TaxID=2792083 RepID=A0A931G7L0_9ACTN|nr:AraC family transcriptional regulator [Actinoplanes aureus]MBG0568364.1 helix-turn-helix transcriptional regulator [Actinoplanes aureus]